MRGAGQILGLWLALGACAHVACLERHAGETLSAFAFPQTLPGKTARRTWGADACSVRRGGNMARVAQRGPRLNMQLDVGGGLFKLEQLASQGVAAELQHLSPASVLLIFAAGEAPENIRRKERSRVCSNA